MPFGSLGKASEAQTGAAQWVGRHRTTRTPEDRKMTKNTGRQATRLLALALASGTIVAAGATGASAAQGSTTKHQLVGKAKTSVVQVSVAGL